MIGFIILALSFLGTIIWLRGGGIDYIQKKNSDK